jgi:hypothetical protein
MMEIYVRLHTGRTVVLDVSAQDTLTDLKRKLAEHHANNLPNPAQSSWRLRGTRVDDAEGPISDAPFHVARGNVTADSPFDVRPLGESDQGYATFVAALQQGASSRAEQNREATPGMPAKTATHTMFVGSMDQIAPCAIQVHPTDTIADVKVRFAHAVEFEYGADEVNLTMITAGQGARKLNDDEIVQDLLGDQENSETSTYSFDNKKVTAIIRVKDR